MASSRRLRDLANSLRSEAKSLREDADAARNREIAAAKHELADELDKDAQSSLAGARCLEKHTRTRKSRRKGIR